MNPATVSHVSYVHCATHGLVPGFVICSCCLLFADPISHIEMYTPLRAGEILCRRLAGHQPHEYRLICKHCAVDLGLNKIGARRIK